jgi:hypothetical protein
MWLTCFVCDRPTNNYYVHRQGGVVCRTCHEDHIRRQMRHSYEEACTTSSYQSEKRGSYRARMPGDYK